MIVDMEEKSKKDKKILIFSTAYFPLVGGAEIAVDEITKRLPDWQFDLITAKIKPGLSKFEKYNNVDIYRVGLGSRFDKIFLPFLGLLKARSLDKKNHYDSTWSIMASFGGFLGLFFKYTKPKKPWLLTLQEGDPLEYILKRVGIFRPLFYQIFHKADYIQSISRFLADWAKQNSANCPIEIIPNGVDVKDFRISSDKENIRQKLGVSQDEKVIITVSRLVEKNGISDLIRAGQYLDFPFKILVVGQGKDEEKLKRLINELGLRDKVLLLGHIEHKKLPNYLSLSDVFVRPSLSEGLGNVFLEAMAVGLPVIGTPVGGIVDFLKDRETGLFCQVKNPKSVAEKIKELLLDNGLREKVIKNGQELVKEKYSWQSISYRIEEIFKKLSLL